MAHGFMRLDTDGQGNHRFEFLRYEREANGKFGLLSAKTDIVRLREAAEHITEYVTNVHQLFDRIYREKKLEPLNMDGRPK